MQTVGEAEQGPDEQDVHQAADLVDGEFDQPGISRVGVAGGRVGGADGQDGEGGQGEGGEPVPGVPAADLMQVQADLPLRGLERLLNAPPVMYLNRVLLS